MWIAGPSSLADMDVDCDGADNTNGKCANDPTGQSITAFQDEVSGFGIKDLDANLHSYVVLGTRNFDPRGVGVESLNVVAVVCNDQLVGYLHYINNLMLFLAARTSAK
jgi:chitosanase